MKDPSLRSRTSKVLPFKPGAGLCIAMHATPAARDFLVADLHPSGPFTCIFFQNLSRVFPVLAVANTGSCVGLQNEVGHPAHHYRQFLQVPMLSACRI